ncbi:hypothetical protein [Legionella cardiaca]|uniref:Uncharacterized protein n=1 Tax=Legionella cardiaca TaxID=1071983 RepID=A0ABY8APQ0_9GAMM|nr:hypothetical protein [Legionella cardiaca]WED42221.1 hypothetical protein PXX05_09800 [Legionella cardiaca]
MAWLYTLIGLLTILIVVVIQYFRGVKLRHSVWTIILALVFTLAMTKLYGIAYYQAWTFEDDLKKEAPLFILLEKTSPAAFQNYIDKAKRDIIYFHSKHLIAYTNEFVTSEIAKYEAKASDESLYHETKRIIDYYNKIYQIDPLLVVYSEFPNQFANVVNLEQLDQLSDSTAKQLYDSQKAIIQSALDSPQPALSPEKFHQAQIILSDIFQTLIQRYGETVVKNSFENPQDPSLNRQVQAKILMDFYQLLYKRGKEDTGLVLRAIASTSS